MGYLSFWCTDLAGNWLEYPINIRYCFRMLRSGVFSALSGVAGGRVVNFVRFCTKVQQWPFSAPSAGFKVRLEQ